MLLFDGNPTAMLMPRFPQENGEEIMNRKPLRIAMIGQKRVPSREGGVEVVVENLSVRMAALGHSVTLYNRKGHHVGGREFDEKTPKFYRGVRIKEVPTVDKKGLAAVTASFHAAWRAALSSADIVHFHAEGPSAMLLIPKMFGKQIVVTIHGLDHQRDKWNSIGKKAILFGERMAAKYADEVIVLSKNVQQYFEDQYGRKTVYIPNGVNDPVLRPANLISKQYGLQKDSYILFLGRLVPEKGVRYLVKAFRGVETDKKLVIAGSGSNTGGYEAELKELAQGDPRILFTGFVQGQRLQELLSNAYIYVLPSDLEGMPLSLLEAMSYGNCCVVSDIDECTEVVENHAVSFPKGNVAALTKTLQELCDNPEKTEQYKAGASEYILNMFSWDNVVDETLEVYYECTEKGEIGNEEICEKA